MFLNCLKIRIGIFEVFGSFFLVIVRNIILVRRIVNEKFIFLFDLQGNLNIKSCIIFKINIGDICYKYVFGVCFKLIVRYNILKFILLM